MDLALGRGAIVAMVLNALRARTRLPIRSAAGLGRGIGAPHGKGDAIQKAAARVRSIRCSQLVDQDVTSFVQWAQRSGRSPSQNRRHGCCSARSARGAAAAALWAHLDGRLAELFATARLELRALLSGPVDGPRCVGPLGHDLLRLRGHGRVKRRLCEPHSLPSLATSRKHVFLVLYLCETVNINSPARHPTLPAT